LSCENIKRISPPVLRAQRRRRKDKGQFTMKKDGRKAEEELENKN